MPSFPRAARICASSVPLLALLAAACSSSGSVTLDEPSPTPIASPTPTAMPCSASGTVCSIDLQDVGDGGPAVSATLMRPKGVVVDPAGNIFVAEALGNRIRRIDLAGNIKTIAGNGRADYPLITGRLASDSAVNHPGSLTRCPDGWLIWNDPNDQSLYGIDPVSKRIASIAGTGSSAVAVASGAAFSVGFKMDDTSLISCDARNVVFIADASNNVVRALNRSGAMLVVNGISIAPGFVAIVAGLAGNTSPQIEGVPATTTALTKPSLAFARLDGSLIITDRSAARLRMVNSSGTMATFAGTGVSGFSGDNGAALAAKVSLPAGMALDTAGRLFLSDEGNQRLRMMNAATTGTLAFAGVNVIAGNITTVAGTGTRSQPYGDGTLATQQTFDFGPTSGALTAQGDLLLADSENGVVRRIDRTTGNMSVIAGWAGQSGNATYFNEPLHLVVESTASLLVSAKNAALYRLDVVTGARTIIAGNGNPTASGDGGPATSAGFFADGIARGSDGTIFVADHRNYFVRAILPNGTISKIAGTGATVLGGNGDGGQATLASFDHPVGVLVDTAGNLFVADSATLRYVNRGASAVTIGAVTIAPGNIDRIAGVTGGVRGFNGDGLALSTQLNFDQTRSNGMQIVGTTLYFADTNNNRIRTLDLVAGSVTTIAGTGISGSKGDGLPPLQANIGSPTDLAIFGGYLYWSQVSAGAIRRLSLAGGVVEPFAGGGQAGFAGDNRPAINAQFVLPRSIAFAGDGTLYVADWSHRIRKVSP